ncbi:CBS domain-containing protein [Tuberibacillus sp. Marseille-P3662]|uniref:CBS domain-containing protein n=1 Tax=Tuberibacillus sp. Marseille-P3662 TaxID=1965358 RepID=UPI000A1C8700|nr:CBS domain-containing protein [Tuberibacillus sp. Marseille-P3662]
MGQKLGSVMTKDVISVEPGQSVQQAAQLMSQYNIGALPVVENGQVKGMITDRDITLRSTAQENNEQSKVSECMSTNNVRMGDANMDVNEASTMMAEHKLRRLPVTENNELVGMVALGDLTQDNEPNDAGQALSSISKPSEPQ